MQHYTTIEQSKKLMELGLSPESADMFYHNGVSHPFVLDEHPMNSIQDSCPCWSVGALLEVMPKGTSLGCRVKRCLYYVYFTTLQRIPTFHDTPIDACYEAVCWLLENNYIKKEE